MRGCRSITLCGLIGHMEKKCDLRFREGFVDPCKEFPYREWLKVPQPGALNTNQRSVMGATSQQGRTDSFQASPRGARIFYVQIQGMEDELSGARTNNKENILREIGLPVVDHSGETRGWGSSSSQVMVKTSQNKNRKKRAVERNGIEEVRHSLKRINLGELANLIQVSVEAATQPHREL